MVNNLRGAPKALFPLFSRLPPPSRYLLIVALVVSLTLARARGQELRDQAHPLSTYLDLRPALAGSAPQTAPRWVESFDFIAATRSAPDAGSEKSALESGLDRTKSVFRIRLQRPAESSDHLQVRVFFDDRTEGTRPRVSVWNELGERMMRSAPLGQGLGLPSSEVVTAFMNGVNYLEIEAPGDGSQVRGVFLSWMENIQVLQPRDFPAQESVRQPFGILPRARTHRDDTALFGSVAARLLGSKPVVLKSGESPSTAFEFELEHPPLLAVVTYEVLGAAVDAAPSVTVNGHALGASEFYLPDLADPAFQGETREAESRMSFRYTGWLRAQKVIPADALAAGLNNLTVRLSNSADSVAIRSVSIQLKYNWDQLDTVLVPAPTPYENH